MSARACSLATGGAQETPSLYSSERNWAVAHAAGGAQCRDNGGDDAADDLEDGLPRFLVLHGNRWVLRVNNFEGAEERLSPLR